MKYKWFYKTPNEFDDIILICDEEFLTGLYFIGSKDELKHDFKIQEKELDVFKETEKWLDIYFKGQEPDFLPKFKVENATLFRSIVSNLMQKIKFGETVTYGDLANEIAKDSGISKMSSQAVGGAVGWNPICIIIPCHRVVGKNGKLTGYGGGMKNKIALLKLEGNDMSKFTL